MHLFIRWLSVLLVAFANTLVFAEPPKSYQPGSAVTTANPLTVVLGLLLVVGFILLLAWLAKRFNQSSFSSNQGLKAIASLAVGTRERIVLVEVGDKQILLGVATGRVTPLHVFDEPVIDANQHNAGDFSNKLKQLLNNDNAPVEKSN